MKIYLKKIKIKPLITLLQNTICFRKHNKQVRFPILEVPPVIPFGDSIDDAGLTHSIQFMSFMHD